MSQNYLKKYLDIKVYKDKTVVRYCNDENICFIHEYKIGLEKISESLVNEIIMSDWVSGVIYTLQNISLTDRVPTFIYLSTERYGSIFEKSLKHPNTYSQFYIEPIENVSQVRVIIKKINYANINSHIESALSHKDLQDNNLKPKSKPYERYTKAISQFKI